MSTEASSETRRIERLISFPSQGRGEATVREVDSATSPKQSPRHRSSEQSDRASAIAPWTIEYVRLSIYLAFGHMFNRFQVQMWRHSNRSTSAHNQANQGERTSPTMPSHAPRLWHGAISLAKLVIQIILDLYVQHNNLHIPQ